MIGLHIPTVTAARPNDNTGKALARRTPGRGNTVLPLKFSSDEAESLRRMSSHLVIKHDKHPSMSLLARLGLQFVEDLYRRDPEALAMRLALIVTEDPAPARVSKRANQ